jgi:hypothetical protein
MKMDGGKNTIGTMDMTTKIAFENNPFDISYEHHEGMIKNNINAMVYMADSLSVMNDEGYKQVTSLYRTARDWKKVIEQKRKEMVEPFRKQVAYINDKAKELTDPLDTVIELSNRKANAYVRFLDEMKLKEEAKLKAAASLFEAEDEVYLPPTSNLLKGSDAVAVTMVEKRFKLTDISLVPTKYLTLNEGEIKKDLKLGILEIPGIEIYEETITKLRAR